MFNTTRIATLCTLLIGAAWSAEAVAATPPALQAVGPLRSALDPDKCVDVSSGQGAINNETNVHLWDCNGGDNQTWYMTMAGELRSKRDPSKCLETWANNVRMNACNGQSWQVWRLDADGELRNEWAMDRCLDVAGANTSNGTNVQLYPCNGTDAQRFYAARVPWAPVASALHSDRCLDVNGGSSDIGANVISWDCHGGDNQAWYLTPDGELRSAVAANRCLDVANAAFASGANLQSWVCNGTDAQRWVLGEDGALRSEAHPEYCVDVSGGSTNNGANVQLYACNGTNAQRWSSSSFVSLEIGNIDGSLALIWGTGATGYALTDPLAVIRMLHGMGYDEADLEEAYEAMSLDQRQWVDMMMFEYSEDFFTDFAQIATSEDPLLHALASVDGVWSFNDTQAAANANLWGWVQGGFQVNPNFAVLYLRGGGAQISAGAGITDVSNVFNADITGEFDLNGGSIGFTLRLSVIQVDLYISGVDLNGAYDDVVSFGEDAIDWSEGAVVDTAEWFEGAASDTANWVEGAAEDVGDAIEDVWDAIFGWL